MRNQAGEKEGNQRSESGREAPRKQLRGGDGKKEERKKQRLSSRNRNRSGRKKAEREGEKTESESTR